MPAGAFAASGPSDQTVSKRCSRFSTPRRSAGMRLICAHLTLFMWAAGRCFRGQQNCRKNNLGDIVVWKNVRGLLCARDSLRSLRETISKPQYENVASIDSSDSPVSCRARTICVSSER